MGQGVPEKTDTAPSFYNIRINLPADFGDAEVGSLALAGEDLAQATLIQREANKHTGNWTITWMVAAGNDIRQALETRFTELVKASGLEISLTATDWVTEPVPDINWLEHCYQEFAPFSVGEFYIFGSHYEGEKPGDKVALQIDAATAFGSGEHGTTKGCLFSLLHLKQAGFTPRNVLDMGTGSGILAIAAAKLWPVSPVLAIDIEDESVRMTGHHAALNDVKTIDAREGDGFAAKQAGERAPFDLVIANILAGPLIEMAHDLAQKLETGGYAILSGLLAAQYDEVMAAYIAEGLSEVRRYDHEYWVALLLQKN